MFESYVTRMPGVPLISRGTIYARSVDQMCQPDSYSHLSSDVEVEPDDGLSLYCKPVEFYNIIQSRRLRNPSFIQRSLAYKIQEKKKNRIQMTVSLSGDGDCGIRDGSMFPLHVMLSRPGISDQSLAHSTSYHFSKVCILYTSSAPKERTGSSIKFFLPQLTKLASKVKSCPVVILFVSSVGGSCFWGSISVNELCLSWRNFPGFSSGKTAEMLYTLDMSSCTTQPSCLDDICSSIKIQCYSEIMIKRTKVIISAQYLWASEETHFNMNNVMIGSQPRGQPIFRLKFGDVIFKYICYGKKMQKTEVTEGFSCPFCLVKCGSFQGLSYHLLSSHDFFDFDFLVLEEFQYVIVSVKFGILEIIAAEVDPRKNSFFFCSRLRRKPGAVKGVSAFKSKLNVTATTDSDSVNCEKARFRVVDDFHSQCLDEAECFNLDGSSINMGVSCATSQSCVDPEFVQSLPEEGNHTVLQFAKTRKLSVERSDSRNILKRQFFHSHRAQPMEMEQILGDLDSEDEVDDDVADFEDRKTLDDFVNVTRDKKLMMHMWNSFVRKQRVIADGHIPWACEAFSRMHCCDIVKSPALSWCWRLFLIKLWNHGLLDAQSINNCNMILQNINN